MTYQQWKYYLGISVGWVALIIIVHYTLDFSVTQYVHTTFDPRSKFISLVHWVANFGLGWPYIIGLGVLFCVARFLWHDRKLTLRSLYLFLCVAISGIICDLLKLVFGRPRPSLWFDHGLSHFVFLGHRQFHESAYTSFPSGHATTAASFAVGLILLFPRLRVIGVIFMLTIAMARVLLLRHYVADVMAGMYLGAMTSWVLYRFMQEGYPAGVLVV